MPVIIVETHTSTVATEVPCLVHCRNCGTRFVYSLRLEGSGEATTALPISEATMKQRAEQKAREDLDNMLSRLDICDAIPCPECYHYRPYMFSKVGYIRYEKLGTRGYLLFLIGWLIVAGSTGYAVLWKGSVPVYIIIAVGVVLLLGGWALLDRLHRLVRRYNPNAEPADEMRKNLAARRAILLADYEARQVRKLGESFARHYRTGADGPLLVDWWLPTSLFLDGGTLRFELPGRLGFVAAIPDDARIGDVIDAVSEKAGVAPVKLRIRPMRVHPDEL